MLLSLHNTLQWSSVENQMSARKEGIVLCIKEMLKEKSFACAVKK